MAIERLAIILVHRAGASDAGMGSGSLDKVTEQLVGNLLGKPGIDVTLVAPLDEIAAGSTDALTLESITSDVAVLTRHAHEQTMAQLESLGFRGGRVRHLGDPDAPAGVASGRRIYTFDLNQPWDIGQWIEALERLRKVKAVKTFGIMPPGKSDSPTRVPSSQPASPRHSAPVVLPPSPNPSVGSSPSDEHLDDLLDQLDDSDI